MTNLPTFRWEHLLHSRSPTVRKPSVVYVSVGNWEGDRCQGWPWAGGRGGRGKQGHPSSSNALQSQLSEGGWVWMKSYGAAITAAWSSGILGSFLSLSDLICPARLMIEILSAIHKMLCESNYMFSLALWKCKSVNDYYYYHHHHHQTYQLSKQEESHRGQTCSCQGEGR